MRTSLHVIGPLRRATGFSQELAAFYGPADTLGG
jgi:hypothetical protein